MARRAAKTEPSEKSRPTGHSQNSFALLTESYFSTPASFVKEDFNLDADDYSDAPWSRSTAQVFGLDAW